MRVMKFGGTSVRDAHWIDRSLDITLNQINHAPVLVSSAMGKTTNCLQEIALRAEEGNQKESEKLISSLKAFHLENAEKLLSGAILDSCRMELDSRFHELGSVVKGLSLLRERTNRSNDLILSFGERLATLLVAGRARERGVDTQLLDARDFIKTDDNFSQAVPILDLTNRLIKKIVRPKPGRLIVVQGFIASTVEGITTTLGRNQSDFTATILGNALEVEEIQIWTDVDGIMTADPGLIPVAGTVQSISYREAAELAHFGARVIHPLTIQPVIKQGIPIWVRNTGNPEGKGTKIISNLPSEGPKAIAFKKEITVISITSGRMLMAYGFLRAIFEIFETYRTPVDLIATSEVSVSVTIDDTTSFDRIIGDLESLGSVSTEQHKCIVCLVGQDLWKSSSIVSRVFSTLRQIPIRMISLGSSDTNLSLVVPQEKIEETIRCLHNEFFE